MKKYSVLAIAGLIFANLAQANDFETVYVKGSEAVQGAKLTYISPTKPVPGGKAFYLELLQKGGASEPTGFKLHVDTGIRCITTPCPSTDIVEFDMTDIEDRSGVTVYHATEKTPGGRTSPRLLTVTESEMETVVGGGRFHSRIVWEVEVQGKAFTDHYFGYPHAVPIPLF